MGSMTWSGAGLAKVKGWIVPLVKTMLWIKRRDAARKAGKFPSMFFEVAR